MNNEEIIAKLALDNGLLSQKEISEMKRTGKEIPLHTAKAWSDRGYQVRKNEKGLKCRLWKKKAGENDKETFYNVNCYLFREDQVEKAKKYNIEAP